MKRDGKRFCHGSVGPAHIVWHFDQQICWMAEIFRHAAFPVYAKNLKAGAAVGAANGAGIAVAAVNIWIQDDLVPYFQAVFVVSRDFFDNSCQFMTNGPGISDQTVGSPESSNIAAADACAHNFNQGFSRLGNWFLTLHNRNFPRF